MKHSPMLHLCRFVLLAICFNSCLRETLQATEKATASSTPKPSYAEADPFLIPKEYWHDDFQIVAVIVPRDKSKIKITEVPEQKVSFPNAFLTQDVTLKPRRKTPIAPHFPHDLNSHRIEGDVFAAVVVETNGKVREVKIMGATEKRFADEVESAVKDTIFEPAKINDTPVRCVMVLPYYFRLTKS